MQIDRSLPYSGSRILYDIFQDLWQRTDSLLWRDGWWPQHCKADCKRREVTGLSDQIIRVFLVFFLPFASQKHLLMPADFLLNVCRWRVECIGTFNYIDWNMSIFHPAHLGVSQWKKTSFRLISEANLNILYSKPRSFSSAFGFPNYYLIAH